MTDRVLSPAILESHIGILGKTGSGKSNLAKVTVEGLLDDGARVCVIDPTGTWYGLRLTRDRKPSPYQVVMFGGNHADIAIGRTHGAAVAETIGTTATPAVIDTRTMTVGERTEFFTAFAETLLQRNRGTLHLVIDEAHLFAPQGRVADVKSGVMLHAANNLVSLGRGNGLRIILISQRPAKLHKDALTQVETLVAMRLIAPQDTAAIRDWVKEWADPEQGREIIASLPSLPTGDAWVWAPEAGILERRHAPLATTLDTGKQSDEPIELEAIDIAAVQERLGEVAADVLANDPRELRKQIAVLRAELEARPTAEPERIEVERIVEVPVLNGQVEHLQSVAVTLQHVGQEIAATGTSIVTAIERVAASRSAAKAGVPALTHAPPVPARPRLRTEAPPLPAGASPSSLGKTERLILAALAGYPTPLTREQLAFLAGYHPRTPGFVNALGALRSAGLAEPGFPARITAAGRQALADAGLEPMDAPPLDEWMSRFGKAERLIMGILLDAHPDVLERQEIADRAGYHPRTPGFANALGKLRGLGLVSDYGLHPDFARLIGR